MTTADLVHRQRDADEDANAWASGLGTREIGRVPEAGLMRSGMPETAQPSAPLFAPNEAAEFRSRWERVQAGFVDQPRPSVEQADALVAAMTKRLAEVFAQERSNLDRQWHRGEDISTEDLRVTLQRYRSFFTRLLSV